MFPWNDRTQDVPVKYSDVLHSAKLPSWIYYKQFKRSYDLMISICLNYISVRSGSKQLASILNFLLSVVGTFVFGYIASQYAFPSVAMVMTFCMLLSYKLK